MGIQHILSECENDIHVWCSCDTEQCLPRVGPLLHFRTAEETEILSTLEGLQTRHSFPHPCPEIPQTVKLGRIIEHSRLEGPQKIVRS